MQLGEKIMRTIIRTSLLFAVLILSAGALFAFEKEDIQKATPKGRMSVLIEPEFTIIPAKTALLIMDYENDMLGMIPDDDMKALVE